MHLHKSSSLILFLSLSLATVGLGEKCLTLEEALENTFLLNGDQRAEILKLLESKTPDQRFAYEILLRKLPARGVLTADFLDFARRSAPNEVMDVLRRLATDDVSQIFLQRRSLADLSARDRVFFDVVVNSRWRSFTRQRFALLAEQAGKLLKVSTYVDLLYKNRNRQVGNTTLEHQLYALAGDYKQFQVLGQIGVHFDTIDNMKSELRGRANQLLEQENAATGLKKIHLRKDRVTLETYLRLLDGKGTAWFEESKPLVDQQWSESRRWFLTKMLPRSPILDNADRASYMASSVSFGLLLYFLGDRVVDWMHPSLEIVFDEEFGFDKDDVDRELTPEEEEKIAEGLKAGKDIEEIFNEMFGKKK